MSDRPRQSTVFTDVDLDAPGRQVGAIFVPHSPHEDAWGAVRIPLAVIANGEGPTVILQGGNHGDEYEGPIVLGELIRELDPAAVSGRLIILPAVNAPAVAAGRRTSPVDGLNFNRTFPGDPLGSITQQISAFVSDFLFPRADAFIDLHSGGSSLDILPSAIVEPAADSELHQRNHAAVSAFGAPTTVVLDNLGDPRTSTATAVRAGLVTVGTEMAGAGTVTLEALEICRRGVRGVLSHLGALAAQPAVGPVQGRAVLEIRGTDSYVLSGRAGVFAPAVETGTEVLAGMVAGHVHDPLDPARAPLELRVPVDGVVFARRHPGRVEPGNCCMVIASPRGGGSLHADGVG